MTNTYRIPKEVHSQIERDFWAEHWGNIWKHAIDAIGAKPPVVPMSSPDGPRRPADSDQGADSNS
jgi:hypothetical protein